MKKLNLVRKQVTVPVEIDQKITLLAEEIRTTPSDIVHRALSLYIFAIEKKRQGLKLGFSHHSAHFDTEVIGH